MLLFNSLNLVISVI